MLSQHTAWTRRRKQLGVPNGTDKMRRMPSCCEQNMPARPNLGAWNVEFHRGGTLRRSILSCEKQERGGGGRGGFLKRSSETSALLFTRPRRLAAFAKKSLCKIEALEIRINFLFGAMKEMHCRFINGFVSKQLYNKQNECSRAPNYRNYGTTWNRSAKLEVTHKRHIATPAASVQRKILAVTMEVMLNISKLLCVMLHV